MPWGAAVAAAGSVIGGMESAQGAKSAANAQKEASQNALNEQRREYDQSRADLAPYRNVGQSALFTLGDYLGLGNLDNPNVVGSPSRRATTEDVNSDQFKELTKDIYGQYGGFNSAQFLALPQAQQDQMNTEATARFNAAQKAANPNAGQTSNTGMLLKPFNFDISQDPGYQFRLDQGNMGVENSAAARGSQLSGSTLKELLRYGSDYASGEFNAAFQRDQATKNQIYSQLSGVAGMGQGATNVGVQAGQQSASNIGGLMTGMGNAQAAGIVGQSNALAGGISGAGNAFYQQQLLRSIMPQQNPGVQTVNAGVSLPAFGGLSGLD